MSLETFYALEIILKIKKIKASLKMNRIRRISELG